MSGVWCGAVRVLDTVTIRDGEELEVCAGSTVTFDGEMGTALVVQGTLRVRGEAGNSVRMVGARPWRGLRVGGTFDADHLLLSDGANCIEGTDTASITVRDARLEACQTAFALAGGATFERTHVQGGASVRITGGILRMTDSVIDLGHPRQSPDCTNFAGGGAVLQHVHFRGCHCPLHINSAPEGIDVRDSVFDEAAYAVMIARTEAVFRGNHFAAGMDHFLDIGGDFSADLAENYFQGDAPRLASGDLSQFTGAEDYSEEPFDDVGPRD